MQSTEFLGNIQTDLTQMSLEELRVLRDDLISQQNEGLEHFKKTLKSVDQRDSAALLEQVANELRRRAKIANAD